jgi:hypothetical protein
MFLKSLTLARHDVGRNFTIYHWVKVIFIARHFLRGQSCIYKQCCKPTYTLTEALKVVVLESGLEILQTN